MEITFDMNDMVHVVNVDFGDGAGKVPAHQHENGGGWVAETAHVEPSCYVGPHAVVYGNARITEKAIINDYAKVYGNARVYGNAKVYGEAQVYDLAQVYDNAKVSGRAKVYESAIVANNAMVYDDAKVHGNAIVRNNAEVLHEAEIYGEADIYDSIKIYDNCVVSRKPIVCFGFDSNVLIADHHVALGCVVFPPYYVEKTGKRMMRLMGYSPEISEKWIQALQFIIEFHKCTDRPEDLENFDERKLIMDLLTAKVGIK